MILAGAKLKSLMNRKVTETKNPSAESGPFISSLVVLILTCSFWLWGWQTLKLMYLFLFMDWTVIQLSSRLGSFFQQSNLFQVDCEQFACPRPQKKTTVTEQQLNCCTYLASLICGDVYGFRLMSGRSSKIVVWEKWQQGECLWPLEDAVFLAHDCKILVWRTLLVLSRFWI